MSDSAIAVREGQALEVLTPSPVFRGASMVKALADYRELQKALDAEMPDQLMNIRGKQFRKKGYWRAIGTAFNLSIEPVTPEHAERSVLGILPDGTDNYVYSVTYKATSSSGRFACGDGTCAASEKVSKDARDIFATEHNVRSHAHTRAFNRAVSNLVAFGEVSAEEVERDEHQQEPAKAVRADGSALVTTVETKTGTGKTGKPWTMYQVTFEDGRSASTFDKKLADQATQAKADGELLIPTLEQKGQYSNLTGLASAGPQQGGGTTSDPSPTPTGSTNGETNGEGVIGDGARKRFWSVAHAQKWTEDEVRGLLEEEGCFDGEGKASAASITRKEYERIVDRLKMNKKAKAGE